MYKGCVGKHARREKYMKNYVSYMHNIAHKTFVSQTVKTSKKKKKIYKLSIFRF